MIIERVHLISINHYREDLSENPALDIVFNIGQLHFLPLSLHNPYSTAKLTMLYIACSGMN